MNKPQGKKDVCFLCGSPNPGTNDHAIPKELFDSLAPSNLITVPACFDHNNSFSKDEEYFRAFLLAQTYNNSVAKKLWKEKVRRSFYMRGIQGLKFHRMLKSESFRAPVDSEGGIYLGDITLLRGDERRINRVLQKMVGGLFYHHLSTPLKDVSFKFFYNEWEADKLIQNIWNLVPRFDFGEKVFSYWPCIPSDNPFCSIWRFIFYERILFIVATEPFNISQPDGETLTSGFNRIIA